MIVSIFLLSTSIVSAQDLADLNLISDSDTNNMEPVDLNITSDSNTANELDPTDLNSNENAQTSQNTIHLVICRIKSTNENIMPQ